MLCNHHLFLWLESRGKGSEYAHLADEPNNLFERSFGCNNGLCLRLRRRT